MCFRTYFIAALFASTATVAAHAAPDGGGGESDAACTVPAEASDQSADTPAPASLRIAF